MKKSPREGTAILIKIKWGVGTTYRQLRKDGRFAVVDCMIGEGCLYLSTFTRRTSRKNFFDFPGSFLGSRTGVITGVKLYCFMRTGDRIGFRQRGELSVANLQQGSSALDDFFDVVSVHTTSFTR